MTFLVSTNPIVTISGSTPIAATEGVTPTISIQDSTINQKGAVQLEDSLTSTSIVKAATPRSVKESYDYTITISGNLQSDIDSKSDTNHIHDNRYYTESEVDTISGSLNITKSDIGHVHIESDITDLDKYTQAEINTISGSLADEINTKDSYSSWSFAIDGSTKDAITSTDVLTFVGGDNITITRSAEDEITISGSSGVTDHGALTGLGDDDHVQYLLRNDFTTYSGTLQTQIDDKSELGHTHDGRYYTESEVNTISGVLQTNIDGKSDTGHLHDNRYYTETELNDGQLDNRYYTETEVDSLITTVSGKLDDHNELNNLDYASAGHTGFAPTSHSHTESDISNLDKYSESEVDTISGSLQNNIDGKSDIGHLHDDRYYTESEVDDLIATASGTTDHSALSNLDYANSGHTGFQPTGDYATGSELTTLSGALKNDIDGKSDIGHIHDDRYYTETEVDDLITTVSGKLDDHNELNNLDYASSGHTGFQPSGDYLTDSEFSTYSGTLQSQIDEKSEVTSLLDLIDTPTTYSGHAGQYLKVSSDELGLEYITAYHVVKVAKSGGQFTSVKDALDSITDSGVFNRYTITVGPGIFAEDNPIQLKPWISIRSTATKEITMVSAQNVNEDLLIGCDRSFVSHMVLTSVSSGSALNMNVPGKMIVGDIITVDCEHCINVNNKDAMLEGTNIYAQTYTSTIGEVITVTSGTASIKNLSIIGDSEIETIIKSDAGNVSIFNLWTESSNITNGLYVNNGGKLFGFASQIKGATNSARIGSGGGALEVVGITVTDSVDYDLLIESSSGTFIGHGCSINRDKLSIANGADVRSSGYDPYADTFRTLGDFSVGMDGSGNISQFGEGGSYEHGVKIKTYDGSTYDTLTTYSGIAFPNTISGTCIYIGNSHRFYGIKYGIDIPIDYGSGSIIWEYYDANNSWLEFNVMNTLQYYSDVADVFTCTGESCTLRFDQNIQCGVYESDVTASGITTTTVDGVNGYWVRCRIVSNITNSPEVSAIRLKGNFTVVRANGTRARHGKARSIHIKELIIGTDAAGTTDEPLNISSNIIYPYRENEMATVGADEAVFGRFVIPTGCDLSCGLYYSYEVTNKSLPGTDQNVHFIVRAAGITENDKFDGAVNETILFDSIFTISSTGSAWTVYRQTSLYRFDINGFKPGDIIYFKLHRPNDGTDTYTDSMCLANHYISYKVWQDGVQLRCG